MSFTWNDNIKLARELIDYSTSVSESKFRCIVSRSYYGAFSTLREFALNHLGMNSEFMNSIHVELIRFMKYDNTRKDLRVLAYQLQKLKDARIEADYILNSKLNWEFTAKSSILKAETMVNSLKT